MRFSMQADVADENDDYENFYNFDDCEENCMERSTIKGPLLN